MKSIENVNILMQKIKFFVVRGAVVTLSYKTMTATYISEALFDVFVFFFISQLFTGAVAPTLQQYGGSYIGFVVIGIAFQRYMSVMIEGPPAEIRDEQEKGTLETLLLSPTSLPTILLGETVWDLIMTTGTISIILLIGIPLGLTFENANIQCAAVILVLLMIPLFGIGMISAGITMIVKAGEPVTVAVSLLSSFFAGVYFPVELIPRSLRSVSYVLPTTYGLDGLRRSILLGADLSSPAIVSDISGLVILSVILVPLGVLIFRAGCRKAKIEGTLSYY